MNAVAKKPPRPAWLVALDASVEFDTELPSEEENRSAGESLAALAAGEPVLSTEELLASLDSSEP